MTDGNVEEDPEIQRKFDKAKVIFEQDCQEFRSLNGFLWQIPVIVSTLTGGLWFGVTKVEATSFVRPALYLLACAVNLTFIVVLWRLRMGVMESLLNRIYAYQGIRRAGGRYLMISMFTLLLLSTVISFVAFIPDFGLIWSRVLATWATIH
jgi:hypothetical protein